VQKFVSAVLRAAILGYVTLDALLTASPRFHRLLAEPPRKRKLHIQYPLKPLS
jgi:hypothetical protein